MVKRVIAPDAVERFKRRIRSITRQAKSVSMGTTMEMLAPFLRGWSGYFGFYETPDVFMALIRWVRLRLPAALWRQWKTPHRRTAALVAKGVPRQVAQATAGSVRGPWRLARSKALSIGLFNTYFTSIGLPKWGDRR